MLVWTQTIRTKSIRQTFNDIIRQTVRELLDDAKANALQNNIASRVDAEFEKLFFDSVSRLPLEERIVAEESYRVPRIRKLMLEATRAQLSSVGFTTMISRMLTATKAEFLNSDIVTDASQKSLAKLLDGNSPPNATIPDTWRAIRFPDHSIVLGDICVLYLNNENKFGGAGKFGDEWRAVFLPISHSCVLVGLKNEISIEISHATLNYFSAALSNQIILSSKIDDSIVALQSFIGTLEPLFEPGEITRLVSEVWENL
jgi:hypothetical protein